MKTDRAKHNILPPSKFGLIQITRQRLRPEVNVEVLETCPACNGTGKIQPSLLFVDQIENAMRFVIQEQNEKKLTLNVHPYIEAFITKGSLFKKSLLKKWASTYKAKINIQAMASYGFMDFKFLNKDGDEIVI